MSTKKKKNFARLFTIIMLLAMLGTALTSTIIILWNYFMK